MSRVLSERRNERVRRFFLDNVVVIVVVTSVIVITNATTSSGGESYHDYAENATGFFLFVFFC